MKNKWQLISSLIQIIIGFVIIIAFFVILITKDDIIRWIVALVLALAFEMIGIIRLVDYFRTNN